MRYRSIRSDDASLREAMRAVAGERRPILVPDRTNIRWNLDFVSDAFTDGRRFRVLAAVDETTCGAPTSAGSDWRSSPIPRSRAFG